MEMLGVIALKVLAYIPSIVWRFIMKPLFVNWWHRICENDLKRHVRYTDVTILAKQSSDNIPYFSLAWTIENTSETNIQIKRVYGTIYMGDRRVANFDVHEPIHKRIDAANIHQYLTIHQNKQRDLKKDFTSHIEFNFYPVIEFWISKVSNNFALEGAFEVHGYGLNVTLPINLGSLKIEGIDAEVGKYRKFLKDSLIPILK